MLPRLRPRMPGREAEAPRTLIGWGGGGKRKILNRRPPPYCGPVSGHFLARLRQRSCSSTSEALTERRDGSESAHGCAPLSHARSGPAAPPGRLRRGLRGRRRGGGGACVAPRLPPPAPPPFGTQSSFLEAERKRKAKSSPPPGCLSLRSRQKSTKIVVQQMI
ncbi:Hypothetical predicted protein [Podarcis lilfordi]|uniref:Uncharacterized protein n=1 Tax=Podarcis lilfordi TaxID=74358 RepID=A0AA35K988_9SAUR|nr:Hypothetical predicted protein [Podarcis lilfordi]